MAELQIPEKYKTGLVKLAKLPEKSLDQMISALKTVRPKLFSDELSAELIPKVQGILADDLTEMINTVVSLSFTGQQLEMAPEELAEEVIDAMNESESDELHLAKTAQEAFKRRLIRLFKLEALVILAKAVGILLDNDNTFCNARILTDMRPVFGADPGIAPNAAVILHTLRITYHHEKELKEFYVALDTADVDELRKILDRAELKAKSLKSVLKKAGIAYLDAPSRGIT